MVAILVRDLGDVSFIAPLPIVLSFIPYSRHHVHTFASSAFTPVHTLGIHGYKYRYIPPHLFFHPTTSSTSTYSLQYLSIPSYHTLHPSPSPIIHHLSTLLWPQPSASLLQSDSYVSQLVSIE